MVVTLLRTGMRVGDLRTLDLRDRRLSGRASEAYRLGTRSRLDGRGRSLFVAADVTRGAVVNRAERTAANRRKCATVSPVDDEFAAVLTRWPASRFGPVSDADPLSVSTSRD